MQTDVKCRVRRKFNLFEVMHFAADGPDGFTAHFDFLIKQIFGIDELAEWGQCHDFYVGEFPCSAAKLEWYESEASLLQP
ncbi:hypothetical protein D3C76_1611060 [compost metagenome]